MTPIPESPPDIETLVEWAKFYRTLGFSVLPATMQRLPDDDLRKPLVRWAGKQDRRRRLSLKKVEESFRHKYIGWQQGRNHPVNAIAVILGKASMSKDYALAVRDFDVLADYQQWASEYPDLAGMLPTVRTSRGAHVYCLYRGQEWRVLNFGNFGGKGELRCSRKGLIYLPPSLHPSGVQYRWANPPKTLADFPVLDLDAIGFTKNYRQDSSTAAELIPLEPFSLKHSIKDKPKKSAPQLPNTSRSLNTLSHGTENRDSFDLKTPSDERVLEIVLKAQPTPSRKRNASLFVLAVELQRLEPDSQSGAWLDAVRYWHQLALPNIGTKAFGTSWSDFDRAWNYLLAEGCRPTPKESANGVNAYLKSLRLIYTNAEECLLTACRHLETAPGNENGVFFMSARKAAEIVYGDRRKKSTAHRLLQAAIASGQLIEVEKGIPSETLRKATRFRLGQAIREGDVEPIAPKGATSLTL